MIRTSPINDTCNNNSPIELYGDIPEHNVVRMKPSGPTEEKNLPVCNTLSLNNKSRREKRIRCFSDTDQRIFEKLLGDYVGLEYFRRC